MKTILNEREFQRRYAEIFYDEYVQHEIKTFGKIVSPFMKLMDYAFECGKENYIGNESIIPEELAKTHVNQIIFSLKDKKNV